jgi:hypothetical protein
MILTGQCLVLEKFVFLSCLCRVCNFFYVMKDVLPYCYEVLYCLFEYTVFLF